MEIKMSLLVEFRVAKFMPETQEVIIKNILRLDRKLKLFAILHKLKIEFKEANLKVNILFTFSTWYYSTVTTWLRLESDTKLKCDTHSELFNNKFTPLNLQI